MTDSNLNPLEAAAQTSSSFKSEIKCKLRYDEIDTENWSSLARGIGLGIFVDYTSTDTYGCPECNELGDRFGDINKYAVTLEQQRNLWIDKNAILNLSFFDMFSKLMQVYPLFTDFFTSINNIVESKIVQAAFGGTNLFATSAGTQTNKIPTNIQQTSGNPINIMATWNMVANIPGSTCFEIGYKCTAAVRFITGFGLKYI